MGMLLSVSVFLAYFYDPTNLNDLGKPPPIIEYRVATPELDPLVIAQIADGDRLSRLVVEPEALSHLLERSMQIVPSVAKALGLPRDPIPVAHLRMDPAGMRGRYIGYHGILRYLSPPRDSHPIDGYMIREGNLETDDGETILFFISESSSANEPIAKVGEYVRIEGFFMKLRDKNLPEELDRAPLLVGPQIYPDFAIFEPVSELNFDVLEDIQDGTYENGKWNGTTAMERLLLDSQGPPLWHLASYALEHSQQISPAGWMQIPPIASKEAFDQFRRSTPSSRNDLRGGPHRILGSFIEGRTQEAGPNPLGIEAWTEVWVQVRDIGGQLLPVWIPKRLTGIKRNTAINCRAFFYRLMAYETLTGDFLYVPLFVAEDLHPLEALPEHPIVQVMKLVLFVVVGAIMLIFFLMNRRMKAHGRAHDQDMIERRRRRRQKAGQRIEAGIEP